MRGRIPVGPELVEKMAGSALARERMQVILETIAGECRVQDACKRLGICQQRFERLRKRAIKAGIAALEPKPVGRPARVLTEAEIENIRLQQRIAELEAELKITHLRVELVTQFQQLEAATKKPSPRSGRTRKSRQSRPRPGNTSKP